MILDGRHYVLTLSKGVRRHIVQRVNARPLPGGRRRSDVKITYTTVSRHLTRNGAEKAARDLNRKAGHAQ